MSLLTLVFLFSACNAYAAFNIPTNITQSDAKIILDRFAVGFVVKTPDFQNVENKLNSYLSASTSYLETQDIAKLGNGTSRTPLQTQLFHFGLQIPFDVDLGVATSFISDQNRIQQSGGFARWSFAKWNDVKLYTLIHGSSINLKSLLGVNLYGTQVAASYQFNSMQIYASTGDLRLTSTFQPQVLQGGGTTTFGIGRRYSHQVFRFSYELGRWTLSAQSDWVKKFHNTILITYRL